MDTLGIPSVPRTSFPSAESFCQVTGRITRRDLVGKYEPIRQSPRRTVVHARKVAPLLSLFSFRGLS